ncbi:PAS domain S-box protein [Massilia consociata]|uniref:PAS domain S-box protein n=1 Tax=Massilia consociata TaxID=760117 RepID=A0ABV6FK74_9BURK
MFIDEIHQRFPDSSLLAQMIAENSVHGLVMMDAQGYCRYANKAWLDMSGYTLEEFAARPLHDLVHHHHPDRRALPMESCP